ncbi:unnamed protein product, partial [Nesidiocoris tenuis]
MFEELVTQHEHRLKNTMTPDQLSSFITLIQEYRDIFSNDPGLIKGYEHKIEVSQEVPPFKIPAYPLKPQQIPKAQAIIQKWLNLGIIRRSASCHVSPLVFVEKKNGDLRPCLDGRHINKYIKPQFECPRRQEEILAMCQDVGAISTLDMSSSFLQVELSRDSCKYVAFNFLGKIYEFTRVPFGLKTSLSALLRALDNLIPEDFGSNIGAYVDDIGVFSKSIADHLLHLRALFQRCRELGVHLNLEKCNFFKEELPMLGLIISKSGLRIDEDKVAAISQFPTPINIHVLSRNPSGENKLSRPEAIVNAMSSAFQMLMKIDKLQDRDPDIKEIKDNIDQYPQYRIEK